LFTLLTLVKLKEIRQRYCSHVLHYFPQKALFSRLPPPVTKIWKALPAKSSQNYHPFNVPASTKNIPVFQWNLWKSPAIKEDLEKKRVTVSVMVWVSVGVRFSDQAG